MNSEPRLTDRPSKKKTAERRLDLWKLVWGQPYIDAAQLAQAIELDLKNAAAPEFRSRLLVRDAARAMRSFWGAKRFALWLDASPTGEQVRSILAENLGRTGFPFIRRRLVSGIGSVEIQQVFTLLGRKIDDRVEVNIAGSIPTLIKGMTARPTADIDFVDEVPPAIRNQRRIVKKIEDEYGLKLTHVQSHYLPTNWEQRRHYLGRFGGLRVYLVDEYDIFVSKLSSTREKHKQDVRVLAGVLDKQTAQGSLLADGKVFLNEPLIRRRIEENWRFIYQEPLPPGPQEGRTSSPRENLRGKGSTKRKRKSADPQGPET